jgi:hypothetical protein
MSFDQFSFDDTIGVNVDSFSAQSSLQYMSRRCIMNLSIRAVRGVGLASGGLFSTASACASVFNNSVKVEGNTPLFLLLLP